MAVAYWSGLDRFVTLTQVGDNWQTRRQRMKQLTYTLNSTVGHVDLVWAVEPNPAENGHHVHGLTGGQYVAQRLWSAAADQCGLGRIVHIERASSDKAGHYAIKAGLYSAKGCAGGPDEYGAWLAAGGGRGVHWTQRAFAGDTFPVAYKAFCAARGFAGSDPGPWVREELGRGIIGRAAV